YNPICVFTILILFTYVENSSLSLFVLHPRQRSLCHLQGDQYPETEPVILRINLYFPIIFMNGISKTLQSISMQALLLFTRNRKSFFKTDLPFIVIFKTYNKETLLRKRVHMDHPLTIIFDLQFTLDGIIK